MISAIFLPRPEGKAVLNYTRCNADWKPISVIGAGVREIRIHVLGEWRVLYVAKFEDAVYVLHAFQKKSRKTRREDIEIARQRYRQIGE